MTDAELPEHSSVRAARLLEAAGDLLVRRGANGFTVADVAQLARVGKGTVYLYWPTKEDLLVGLIGRAFLSLIDDVIELITAEPDLARPARFCPLMLEIATAKPLVAALQRHDEDLLGVLARHPRSVAIHQALGPSAVLSAVLPFWRANGSARTDWTADDQAFALQGLLTGIAMTLIGPVPTPLPPEPLAVLGAAVTALLGRDRANQKQVRATADDVIAFLRRGRTATLDLMEPAQP